MRIVAAEKTEEIEIRASRQDLRRFADALLLGEALLSLDVPNEPPVFYDVFLRQVRIGSDPALPGVRIDWREGGELAITGEQNKLNMLAKNIRNFAEESEAGRHMHIEHYPGHFYLVEGSAPVVVSLAE